MKFVFFGGQESAFAQIVLDGLKNAGLPPVAEIRDAKKPLDPEYLKSLNAEFFLVASFAKILKKEVLNIAPVIGVHPSLLPKYRGPSPIQSAILNDEKETGTTIFLIDEKVDHGPILSNVKCQMLNVDTYTSLEEKLAKLSAELAIETLPKYLAGKIKPQIQDEAAATYTKKIASADAEVHSTIVRSHNSGMAFKIGENARDTWLKIRALNPEPGVFTMLTLKNSKTLRLKLLDAELSPEGQLVLKTVQPEGKKLMSFGAFLNGYEKQISNF